jgi:hypothetical protein
VSLLGYFGSLSHSYYRRITQIFYLPRLYSDILFCFLTKGGYYSIFLSCILARGGYSDINLLCLYSDILPFWVCLALLLEADYHWTSCSTAKTTYGGLISLVLLSEEDNYLLLTFWISCLTAWTTSGVALPPCGLPSCRILK